MREVGHGESVGAYEAKTYWGELLDRVHGGEEFIITRHGSPVAKLSPIKVSATREERREAIEHWLETSRGLTLGGLKIRDLINEGRL